MSCSGPCNQGKSPCPCPQSCQLKQQDTPPDEEAPSNGLFYLCFAVILVWVIAVVVAPMFAGYIVGVAR